MHESYVHVGMTFSNGHPCCNKEHRVWVITRLSGNWLAHVLQLSHEGVTCQVHRAKEQRMWQVAESRRQEAWGAGNLTWPGCPSAVLGP